MRVLPFFVCGIVLIALPGQSTASHAQVLSWTVLFAALWSTIDGAFRVIARDPDPDAGARFGVLLATAVGMVMGSAQAQLWSRLSPHAPFVGVIVTIELLNIVASAVAGDPLACAARLRARGWLRPALGWVVAMLLGCCLHWAPSAAIVIVTLATSSAIAKYPGLDPDYVAGPGEVTTRPAVDRRAHGGEVAARRTTRPSRPLSRGGAAAASSGEVAAEAKLESRPAAADAPAPAPAVMPLAPGGVAAFAHEVMPAVAACPLCAQPVLAHVVPCRECGAIEHPACAGARCSVCGIAKPDLPRRAA